MWTCRHGLGRTQIPGEARQPSRLALMIWAVLTAQGPGRFYLNLHSLGKEGGLELLALGTGLCVTPSIQWLLACALFSYGWNQRKVCLLLSGLLIDLSHTEWHDEVHPGTREFAVAGSSEIKAGCLSGNTSQPYFPSVAYLQSRSAL